MRRRIIGNETGKAELKPMKMVLYNKETIGFDPYSVEFKKNLDMSQECEEHIYNNNYKTYSQSNELTEYCMK